MRRARNTQLIAVGITSVAVSFWISTAANAAADATDAPERCEAISNATRLAITAIYDCRRAGECIDAHIGQAFWRADKIDSKHPNAPQMSDLRALPVGAFKSEASPGQLIIVKSFALTACAATHLKGISLRTVTVKRTNSTLQGSPKTAPAPDKGAKAAVAAAADIAKDKIKASTSPAEVATVVENLQLKVKGFEGLAPALQTFANLRQPIDPAATIASAKDKAEKQVEGVTRAASQATGWHVFLVNGAEVSVQENSTQVPDGDDNRFIYLTTSDSDGGLDDAGKVVGTPFWPSNTMTISIDHGKYYWDAGVLFAGVHNGMASFTSTTSTSSTMTSSMASAVPTSYSWAFQSMIAGNVYPAGRDKFVPYSCYGLIPGIQVGLNSDLSKIAKAVSLGLIFEPVTGLAISGGGIFFARGNAPAAANGTQTTEQVFLPYLGVSLNTEFYNSLKSVSSPSSASSSK